MRALELVRSPWGRGPAASSAPYPGSPADAVISCRAPASEIPPAVGARDERIVRAIADMALRCARTGDVEAARNAVDEALVALERARDADLLAAAAVDIGEALLLLGEPSCRELLEDAGTLCEDAGDGERVRRVDALLRAADARIEPSPRSFQARRLALRST